MTLTHNFALLVKSDCQAQAAGDVIGGANSFVETHEVPVRTSLTAGTSSHLTPATSFLHVAPTRFAPYEKMAERLNAITRDTPITRPPTVVRYNDHEGRTLYAILDAELLRFDFADMHRARYVGALTTDATRFVFKETPPPTAFLTWRHGPHNVEYRMYCVDKSHAAFILYFLNKRFT